MSRWDSAAIVSNTSELLPDPETPVTTVSRRLGSSTLTSLRLFSRAPWTRITSWRAPAGSTGGCWSVLVAMLRVSPAGRRDRRTATAGSAQLLDAQEVARRVADGAVADAVRLVRRLLDDLGVGGLE